MSHDTEMSDSGVRQLIAFNVRGQEFCVDIKAVREIRGWSEATPLPQSPPYVCGVINLRGAVLPIIDMAARLGLPKSEPDASQVIIVVWIGGRLTGLVVDSVSDILDVSDDAFQPTPDMGSEMTSALVSRLLTIDDQLIGLIVLDNLLPAAA